MKRRNPYAAAHSMRGGAGAGAHKDRRREILDDLTDPYSQEWIDACPVPARVDADTSVRVSGSMPAPGVYKPLSREFLLARGYCCNSGCTNCPYGDGEGS
jgi:hypothetical protein